MESNGIRSNVFRYAGVVFKLAFVQRRIECTLQMKPRRTASGVATIAVRTTCIFRNTSAKRRQNRCHLYSTN